MKILLDTEYVKAFINDDGEVWISHKWSDGIESIMLPLNDAKFLADAIQKVYQ